MKVVLDTHVLVWLMEGESRLAAQSRRLIDEAATTGEVLVSAITPWEIAMLIDKGRLVFNRDVSEWLELAFRVPGIHLSPLSPVISVGATRLPGLVHGDPADRIIIATARHEGACLITEDRAILDYAAQGHVQALRAAL